MSTTIYRRPSPSSAYRRPSSLPSRLDFHLPRHREATCPPEARGLRRDQVGLMVSHYGSDTVHHSSFTTLAQHLSPGDILVVNTSATRPAAVPCQSACGDQYHLHFSTALPSRRHVVEVRRIEGEHTVPYAPVSPGDTLYLPLSGQVEIIAPHRPGTGPVRLWEARVDLATSLDEYLSQVGFPIRYSYVDRPWPLAAYQTVFGLTPGSAEMPSAGRPFTATTLADLARQGVELAPILLHTGVASQEEGELPYAEYFEVPSKTAALVNEKMREGRRIIALGTTAVRAIESAVVEGEVVAKRGWTDLVITPSRGMNVVNGLVTGFHEPEATHLAMLEGLAGRRHLEVAYREALAGDYLWHEFGDIHLILP